MSLFSNKSNPATHTHPPLARGGQGGGAGFTPLESPAASCWDGTQLNSTVNAGSNAPGGLLTGFTLIEVLIAVAILSIILTAIYSTFFLSHKAIEGADESMLKLQESRRAIDILRRELDSAFYRVNEGNTFLKIEDRDIYGKQAAQLTFTSFSPLRPGLSKISYYIEDKDGELSLFKKIESPYSKEETEGVDIIEDLEEFTVEAKYNDKWVKTWDTEIIKSKPEEIRLSLSVMIKGRKVDLFDISRPRVGKTI